MQKMSVAERDQRARYAPELAVATAAPGVADPLIDGMHEARAALEQRGEDHELKQVAESGQIEPLQQIVRRQRRAGNVRVVGHHAGEEHERGQHRQRPGDEAGDHGVAIAARWRSTGRITTAPMTL